MRKSTANKMLLMSMALGLTTLTTGASEKEQVNKKDFTGYLFTYFEGSGDQQEHLRFAISEDAKTWYALNNNLPVIASDTISTSGGIRDPHILRGEDGCYYIVATDMNTKKFGWKENPGIVLMKSKDLVNWTHSKIVLKTDYAKHFSDAYWVWAPQTIYDRKAKKYMIYFTLQRTGDGRKSLYTYYAYANKDFTGFEGEPKVLFKAKYGCIDNDIIERNGMYHMFYKGNIKDTNGKEIQNGIQQATAKNLKGPWKEDFKFIDAYANSKTGVEGSGVFKLNDRDEYVLMYDLYGSGRYEYQTSKDLMTFSTKPESFTKDFFPRHGTVCSITSDEIKRLQQKWGYVINHSYTGKGNPILPNFHADPEILYSNKTGKYYIYSTTDGRPGWGGFRYYVYSSSDLTKWKNEGVALDAKSDQISWANGNLWAPAAVEVKQADGSYKYYLYFSARPNDNGRKQMGVAVSDSPIGPFVDLGHPLLAKNHPGCRGQLIDVDVFIDPVSNKPYLYWGNSFMAGAELEPSMTKIKDETVTVMTPQGGTLQDYAYREAPYVFYRNGLYYFMWSVDDTGSANYHVAYGTSKSPLGPIEVAKDPIVLIQDPQHEIYGTAHNSVIQIPGTDEWYIVYHRINKEYLHDQPGVHREVCIDKMEFNSDGTIKRVIPTDGMKLKPAEAAKLIPLDSIQLSDPCVLADQATKTYYMTGTGGMLWTSKDLKYWTKAKKVADTDPKSWMGPNPMIWAAELHQYKDKYYYFATFTNPNVIIDEVKGNKIERRACQVLESDKAAGPYRPFGDATYLPANCPTLDGTFWIDKNGKPYMVYCGEWLQNWNGTIEKIELKPDLSGTIGKGKVLFRASDSPWSKEKNEKGKIVPNKVTDGPWLFRTKTGKLGMLWTSWVYDVYTQGVAYSKSGTLDGPWIQEKKPITPPNFGHSMLFQTFEGQWLMSVHSHYVDKQGKYIRVPHFFKVNLDGDKLVVEGEYNK